MGILDRFVQNARSHPVLDPDVDSRNWLAKGDVVRGQMVEHSGSAGPGTALKSTSPDTTASLVAASGILTLLLAFMFVVTPGARDQLRPPPVAEISCIHWGVGCATA